MELKFQGKPVKISGNEIKIGENAPDFTAYNNSLEPVSLKDTKGVRVFLTAPSIDTPVCDLEVRTFNERASEISGVTIYTITMDLPFAQSRWCVAHEIKNVITLSDYKYRSVGKSFGTYIDDLGLLARAAFVVDSSNKVTYAEYVSEITDAPNYEAILKAAKELSKP